MLKILVTGTSGTNVGTQVLMSLLMMPHRYDVVATDMAWPFFGYYKANAAYQVPPASSPDYLPRLLEICRKESIQAMVPGSEAELAVCSRLREDLAANGVTPLTNNARVIETARTRWPRTSSWGGRGSPSRAI